MNSIIYKKNVTFNETVSNKIGKLSKWFCQNTGTPHQLTDNYYKLKLSMSGVLIPASICLTTKKYTSVTGAGDDHMD